MPFLQTSGAISINDIKNLFGGPSSPALSNYYRGGAYIPSTKTITVREPSTGGSYSANSYFWRVDPGVAYAYWDGVYLGAFSSGLTSIVVSGVTYFREDLHTTVTDGYTTSYLYRIFRTYPSTASINGNIPSSGAISLNQFYSAEKP